MNDDLSSLSKGMHNSTKLYEEIIARQSAQNMLKQRNTNYLAGWTYARLVEYIKDFESELDDEHEIGARLVSFGSDIQFHVLDIGYYDPDIISFSGITTSGQKVQLVQNISQLSVLLITLPKLEEKPRRLGFQLDAQDKE